MTNEQIEAVASDLAMLKRAIEEGDPKGESLIRVADVAAAFAAMPDRWQPIETAPRDGADILAYSEHGCTGMMLVRYIAPCDFLTDSEIEELARNGMDDEMLETPDWFAADFIQGSRLSPDCYPTHWQPLPAPPTMEPGA